MIGTRIGSAIGSAAARVRPRTSLRTLALLSLGLNLFLAAALLATWHHPPPPPYQPMPDRFVERMAPDLSPADAARMRAAFEPLRPRYAALTEEYREAGQAVRALIQQERFDPQALRAATEAARAKRRQLGELTEETVLGLMPELSPAGRLRLIGSGRAF
ncbi:periplasmic heavy metal sensor [Azospirillum doebereinerae]|uniref:Periplasmic heavy metal sensor n=1 Tax=Azospirillum doebereinerae TaxID=92933 RepID=A0A433J9H8_9PROT|nr:periplasmic heavy metal sensor [Azospirillum doebereinerae]MCG5242831.1 periplasmic heavy metal sensor [Azospirillum doebereinerae]RUQ71422.1 periplasmic heavy metal sensor [Azospirillum doebereinerae]